MKFKRELQETIDADWQGVTLNLYSIEEIGEPENTVINFLKSDSFEIECQRDFIKDKSQEEQDKFLRTAFNADQLKIEDFRVLNYGQICQFFEEYAQQDWGNETDRKDFVEIWNKLKGKLEEHSQYSIFYLISLEWLWNSRNSNPLENTDSRLRDPAFWVYTYYFLIIAIDDKERKLLEVEMFYE